MIRVPQADAPTISVVLPVYGRWDWVQRALEALIEHTPPVFEVIAVDNASPDGTGDRLAAEVEGITLIRNDVNEGFGRAVNRAAAVAKGEHLCLLNTDALVGDGWLPPILTALTDPSVAVAVPMYLWMDGTVQEAGSCIGSDGVTVAIGRGLPADAPAVNFPRDVDFGSAACMLVRASAFAAAGGFSDAYGLGYYEDVELCLELRTRGWRTRYVPGTRVRHGLGASLSAEEASLRSERNREVVVRRRRGDLRGRPALDGWEQHLPRVVHARDWLAPHRLLVLAERLPLDRFAAAVDMAAVRPRTRVSVAVAGPCDDRDVRRLLDAGIEVVPDASPAWLAERAAHPTAVIIDGPSVAQRLGEALLETQPQATVAYDMAAGDRTTADAVAARARETALLRAARLVLVPAEAHERFVRRLAPAARIVVTDSAPPAGSDVLEALGFAPSGP